MKSFRDNSAISAALARETVFDTNKLIAIDIFTLWDTLFPCAKSSEVAAGQKIFEHMA